MASPHEALVRFEAHKDNPIVQGLVSFLTTTYAHSLNDVVSWSIDLPDETGNPYSEKVMMQAMYGDIRRFHVTYFDNTGVRGWIREAHDGTWQVYSFQQTVTVVGNWPTITSIEPESEL